MSRSRLIPVLSAVELRGCRCAVDRDVSAICVGALRVLVNRPKVLLTVNWEYCSNYQNNLEIEELYRMFKFNLCRDALVVTQTIQLLPLW